MRPVVLIGFLLLCFIALKAQDNIRVDYAVLHLSIRYTRAKINYSDGHISHLKILGVIDSTDTKNRFYTRDQVIFKCFKKLNSEGYELVNAQKEEGFISCGKKQNDMCKPVILILMLLPLVIIQSCKKCNDPANPECKNYNPCYTAEQDGANFTIQQVNTGDPNWIPYTDDTCNPAEITFTALLSNVQYEWHIGSGIYTTQSVSLGFGGVTNNDIPIMLVIKRTSATQCFPNNNQTDTMIKTLSIRPNLCRVYGTYYGCFTDSPAYKFSVTIEKTSPPPGWLNFALSNCADTMLVQTYGWPIPASLVSGSYPCGTWLDAGPRELVFDVQPPDSIQNTSAYTSYPVCVALLDSTYNNINIYITCFKPNPDSLSIIIKSNKIFQGIRQ